MMVVGFPIFFVLPVCLPILVQLIHPKDNRHILRLPQLLIGVLIFHAEILHHAAAPGIVPVVGGGDIGNAIRSQPLYNGLAGFGNDALMPKLITKAVP